MRKRGKVKKNIENEEKAKIKQTKKIVNLIYFRLKKLLSHFLDFPCTPTHKQKDYCKKERKELRNVIFYHETK